MWSSSWNWSQRVTSQSVYLVVYKHLSPGISMWQSWYGLGLERILSKLRLIPTRVVDFRECGTAFSCRCICLHHRCRCHDRLQVTLVRFQNDYLQLALLRDQANQWFCHRNTIPSGHLSQWRGIMESQNDFLVIQRHYTKEIWPDSLPRRCKQ